MIIDGKRSLAHVEKVAWVKPIEGADNIEVIGVLGWVCIAKIGEFKKGDLCVYIEIDSKVPEKEWSEFLRKKHFKIKTMKLNRFNVISQGIALPLEIFNEDIPKEEVMLQNYLKSNIQTLKIRDAKAKVQTNMM